MNEKCGDSRPQLLTAAAHWEFFYYLSQPLRRRIAEVTKLTTISAIPAPSSSRCGLRRAPQTTSGGHKILASRKASMQASTPDRNPAAVATRCFFSGVIAAACPQNYVETAGHLLQSVREDFRQIS
jgi:hypothetical protein